MCIMKKIKYKELQDREWLFQKHIIEKLSCRKIAVLIGVKYYTSVRDALKRLNIETSRPRIHSPKGQSYSPKLNDRDWLIDKYISCKWGLNKIAKEVGVKSSSSVRDALKRMGIPVRDKSNGYLATRTNDDHLCLSQDNIDIIHGCLLGDGWLKRSNVNTSFGKKNVNYDHIELVAKSLFGEKFKLRISGPYIPKKRSIINGRKILSCRPVFSIHSLVHPELNDLYSKWYSNGKKVIPRDLEINKVVLLHWFLDDGYSQYKYTKKNGTRAVSIVLCSERFLQEDQKYICEKIYESLGLKFSLLKRGKYIRMELSKKDTSKFFDIIGPCPVPSMAYKWK